ncbi:leucyl aminopeptidase family protein [Sandarakinorhabdus limnophila]|uniref:leucyl aminopeptidase family protein n=1 Tax=Sandarakinorhabdus limnophila TaxID=210512 RepID=UPI0026EDA5F6|nr:leucyl aminopeptidase family protein [Sandarakinorhabdus limnophila]MCM0032243.1 leucyl aminopeptidase family protein [Sandarakinorhabdus limnophila]
MTDFAALLAPTDGQPSVPLIPVTKAGLDGWLATQSERVRVAVAAQDFKAAPDSIVILPGDGPADWFVVAGVAEGPLGPWALATPAEKLPAGRFALAGKLGQAGLGWCLAQHRFGRYRRLETKGARVLTTTSLGAISAAASEAEAVALVRDLVDTPASDLGPAELAKAVIDALGSQAEVRVTTGEALIDQNFPALHAVGRAAAQAPRLIEAVWGDAAHPVLAIIGKGITFDSGGLNIKPGGGMALMKKDMGGAAHALALAKLVIQGNLRVRLHLIIPAAENAIAGNAMRPGDIISTRAGKTVEITNTDAEGRLVLCDAIALAAEKNPMLIIDFATLTGAARVALGPQLPALFANDDALASELVAAGAQVGDPVWRLPLWAPYHDMLKSSLADMVNSADGGFAGAITAALFLEKFVPTGVPWAHFDTFAWNNASRPGRPKGGEALALRASWAMLRSRFG